jgi:hypothetical protein
MNSAVAALGSAFTPPPDTGGSFVVVADMVTPF